MTDDLSAALHRTADALPDAPDRLGRVRAVRRRRRLRRLQWSGSAAAVLVIAGATLYAVSSPGTRTAPDRLGVDPATASTGGYGASGRVVSVPGKHVRFCAPAPEPAVLIFPKPPPGYCDFGVDVDGVDLSRLQNRYEKAGAIEGYAALRGQLHDGLLTVDAQGKPSTGTAAAATETPPCRPPTGGWRRTGSGNPDPQALQDYQGTHPGAVIDLEISRPTPTQAVLVALTPGDPTDVRAALLHDYAADELCVATSAYSPAEVQAVAADPALQVGVERQVYATGRGFSPQGQLQYNGQAVLLTPDLAAAVARHPQGLVEITVWLQPVGAG
jgi:hypothetical protein